MKLLTLALLICLLVISFMQYGCRYDKQLLAPVVLCDTSNVKFKTTVQPILITNCLIVGGCHGDASPPNGVFLNTYAGVTAQLPKLLGVIKHLPGFDPMPKGKDPLNSCDISKIERWILNGAKND